MGFRGDEFVLIDGECLGDGQDDTLPMDTWLVNRLWGNTMFLASEPRTICWSPIIADADLASAAGIKPYAILNRWATVWAGLMYIHPGQSGIVVTPVGIIESSGTGTKNIYIRVSVEGLGNNGENDLYGRTQTGSGALALGRDRITVTFDEPFNSLSPQLRWVEIAMRSEAIVSTYLTTTGTGQFVGSYVQDSAVTPVLVNSATGNPDADSIEQMAIELNISQQTPAPYNILGVTEIASSKESDTSRAYTIEAVPSTATFNWDYDLEYITYWSPRAIVFEPVMQLDSAGRLARATLGPNLPVDYGPAVAQVDAVHQLHRRPRTVGIGPRGKLDTTETFFGALGYRFCWPYVMGNAATTTIIDDSVYLTTENPIIEVQGWCVVVQHNSSTNLSHAPATGSFNKKEQGTDEAGRVQWDFVGTLTQMVDPASGTATWAANATSYGSTTDNLTFDLHPTNFLLEITPAPIARGLEFMYSGTIRSPFDQGGWFKEGSLCGADDYAYLQPFTLRIDTAGMDSTITGKPFRLKVTAVHNTAARNDYLTILPSGSAATVRFVLGHYTVAEIPTNGRGTALPLTTGKTIPADLVLPDSNDHWPKAYITATKQQRIAESLHYHWQRAGALIPGMTWETPFATASTTYTGVNDNVADLDLTSWAGSCVLQRPQPDGSYALEFQAFIQNLDVQISVLRFDDRTTLTSLGSVTLSNSTTDAKWVTGELAIAAADALEGGVGSTKATLYIYAKAKVPSIGTGYLWQVG